MKKYLVLIILFTGITMSAQDMVEITKVIKPESVDASSSWGGGITANNTVNESGLARGLHDNNGNSGTMWHTLRDPESSKAHAGTVEGPAWLKYDFGQVEYISEIVLWNHNQANLTDRGIKKCFIDYSKDGANWVRLMDGENNYFIIPRATGKPGMPASLKINSADFKARHLVLTASIQDGNYGSSVYGISEIRLTSHKSIPEKQFPLYNAIFLEPGIALLKHKDGIRRPVKLRFVGENSYRGGKLTVKVGDKKETLELPADSNGFDEFKLTVPVENTEESMLLHAELNVKGKVLQSSIQLKPVRSWEMHIVHQTHLDIGFTHTQDEVLGIQVEHIRTALKYIEETKDYPEEARFRWHPEGMWAVDEFMRVASEAEKGKFLEACKRKQIHIDVMYAQAMTGMYTEEELFELLSAAKRFEKKYGVEVTSGMQSDVPGYTWGLATALAHHDVPYLSVGPNWFATGGGNEWYKGDNIVGQTHRGGRVFEWADQPFWWIDPSGKQKTLLWMTGWGYSGFHGGRGGITEDKVFNFLDHLDGKGYTYDMVMWRYAIGADNGPPDPELCKTVKAWNEKYVYPKLIMTGNSEVMKQFAERYGEQIPKVSGDFTPYWEDGCASTAKATSTNRTASEKLVQAQILWSVLKPDLKLHEQFDMAWNKMIMYDEHTWGAWNSISAPDDSFVVKQDKYKQAYAFDADVLSNELLDIITENVSKPQSESIDIYNSSNWDRNGLIMLTKEQSAVGDLVKDEHEKTIPSQRLASGELAFVARDVPAFGAKRFTIHKGKAKAIGSAKAKGLMLFNEKIQLRIDPEFGAISYLKHKEIDNNLVDTSKTKGLNDYLYIIGRDASKNRSKIEGRVKVIVVDPGPLVAALRIESDAPGCKKLTRYIRLVDGFDYIELINTTDKLKELRPEGVYFGFPFNIPNPVSKIDVPWAVVQPEKDQIEKGANKNFFCVQRWVDISNEDYGVTWVSPDAPMLQFDPIKIALPFGTEHFRSHIDPGAYIHSWVMNNHWETNYKAYQEGEITFRYVLQPHPQTYDPVKAQRFGRELSQPLIVVLADPEKQVIEPMLDVKGEGVVVTSVRPSRDGKALMVRLFNVSEKSQKTSLAWNRPVGHISISNPMEDKIKTAPIELEMTKFQVVTLRVER